MRQRFSAFAEASADRSVTRNEKGAARDEEERTPRGSGRKVQVATGVVVDFSPQSYHVEKEKASCLGTGVEVRKFSKELERFLDPISKEDWP